MWKLDAGFAAYRRSGLEAYGSSPVAFDTDCPTKRLERSPCSNPYISVNPYERSRPVEQPMQRADVPVSVDKIPIPDPIVKLCSIP